MIPSKLTPLAALFAMALVAGCGRNDVANTAAPGPSTMSEASKASTSNARSAADAASASTGGSTAVMGAGTPAVPGALSTAGAASGGNSGPAGGVSTDHPGTVTGSSNMPTSTPGSSTSALPPTTGGGTRANDMPQSPGTGRGTERSGDNGNKKGAGLGAGAGDRHAAADGAVVVTMALTPTQAGSTAAGTTAGSSTAAGAGPAASGSAMQSGGGVASPHGGVAGDRLLAPADRSFMNNAAIGGIFEVAVGKVAAERAGDAKVKDFGNMLVEDHTKANNELAALATARGITPPTKLPAAKQAKIDRLAKLSGRSFDRQFLQQVGLKDHQEDIRLFEKAARSARDPEVKAFAEKTLPTLRKHHQEAQELLRTAGAGGHRNAAAETQQR